MEKLKRPAASLFVVCGLIAAGCATTPSRPSDEQIRQQAAATAQRARQEARVAGKQAAIALREAGRATKAAVAGATQGWKEGAPARKQAQAVNINSASRSDLEALPGVHRSTAQRIIKARPYQSTQDLLDRKIVTQAEYARIAGSITVRQ